MMTTEFWPRQAAAGVSLGVVQGRLVPEDFYVEELPSWSPSGDGEHDVLWVEKRGANTRWVADQLAKYADVHPSAVSYAGLKDRHALTLQWFSVHRPGRNINWFEFACADVRILKAEQHSRKLRIGTLAGNKFAIRLQHDGLDETAVLERVKLLCSQGVPNYFGPQRFGREGDNLRLATALANGRKLSRSKRSFALSAARAMIFNDVLAHRVADNSWNRSQSGDVLMLAGSQSVFDASDEEAAALEARTASQDVHPTAPLWGRGALRTTGAIAELEQQTADRYPDLVSACERGGADMQRRATRISMHDMTIEYDDQYLLLHFSLPAGCFATAVINELVTLA